MTTFEIKQLNLAQCVLKRPRMFTVGGTLAEVLALFSGYELAMRSGARPRDDSPSLTINWLDKELGIDTLRPEHRHSAAVKKFHSEAGVLTAMDNFAETLHQTDRG